MTPSRHRNHQPQRGTTPASHNPREISQDRTDSKVNQSITYRLKSHGEKAGKRCTPRAVIIKADRDERARSEHLDHGVIRCLVAGREDITAQYRRGEQVRDVGSLTSTTVDPDKEVVTRSSRRAQHTLPAIDNPVCRVGGGGAGRRRLRRG